MKFPFKLTSFRFRTSYYTNLTICGFSGREILNLERGVEYLIKASISLEDGKQPGSVQSWVGDSSGIFVNVQFNIFFQNTAQRDLPVEDKKMETDVINWRKITNQKCVKTIWLEIGIFYAYARC